MSIAIEGRVRDGDKVGDETFTVSPTEVLFSALNSAIRSGNIELARSTLRGIAEAVFLNEIDPAAGSFGHASAAALQHAQHIAPSRLILAAQMAKGSIPAVIEPRDQIFVLLALFEQKRLAAPNSVGEAPKPAERTVTTAYNGHLAAGSPPACD